MLRIMIAWARVITGTRRMHWHWQVDSVSDPRVDLTRSHLHWRSFILTYVLLVLLLAGVIKLRRSYIDWYVRERGDPARDTIVP